MADLLIMASDEDLVFLFRRIFDQHEIRWARDTDEAVQAVRSQPPDLLILDVKGPGTEDLAALRAVREVSAQQLVIILTAYGTAQTAVEAIKQGAHDYLFKPFDVGQLRRMVADALEVATQRRAARRPVRPMRRPPLTGVIGTSPAMQEVYRAIGKVAPTDLAVLITGESGTGKELVARMLHEHGSRADKPFLALNCAAIPEPLLESELFGYERGAFTGALSRKIGKLEVCNGGTLFLDEIGDMSTALQTKMLRVLQDGTFERIGGTDTLSVDVRVIAATNRDLEKEVDAGRFRKDLYFRLKVVTLTLPPLKERKEDIPLLIDSFLREYSRKHTKEIKGIEPEAVKIFCDYRWPGNVRELKNALETMVVLASNDMLKAEDIPANILSSVRTAPQPQPVISAGMTLEEAEKELIKNTLALVNGNRKEAAKRLGIGERSLYRKIERYELS